MNITEKELAVDMAIEIVLGGDRLGREDLRYLVREGGFSMDRIRKLTEQEIREQFGDGEPVADKEFIKKELDFWFAPEDQEKENTKED